MLAEELAQGVGELFRLAQLAADNDAVLELLPRDRQQLGRAVIRDACGCELRRADLEADEPLRSVTAWLAHGRLRQAELQPRPLALGLRLLLLLLLGRLRFLRRVLQLELFLPEGRVRCSRSFGSLHRRAFDRGRLRR